MSGRGALRAVTVTGLSPPRRRRRFSGSDSTPSRSSSSSTRTASRTRLRPRLVFHPRCSQTVLPSSLRLSPGSDAAISCTSAIWRRVSRLPKNVVSLRRWMRGSMAAGELIPKNRFAKPGEDVKCSRKQNGNESATSVLSVLYQTPHLRHPLQRYNRMPLGAPRSLARPRPLRGCKRSRRPPRLTMTVCANG